MTISKSESIDLLKEIAIEAGDAILKVYKSSNFEIEAKSDNSPLTAADKASHNIIFERLSKHFKNTPILSEEGKEIGYDIRKKWDKYWLIDPLDGTKEFIKKNGEFTVNIALIKNNTPILGIIYAPVLNELYWGGVNKGAYFETPGIGTSSSLPLHPMPKELTAVASRSHSSQEEKDLIKSLKITKIISKGSSLKFCMMAKGLAHYYIRFGPTMEWDTAAGHAIVASVGQVLTKLDGRPFTYNKENLLNPGFIVANNKYLSTFKRIPGER